MKDLLFPFCLTAALIATAGLAYVALQPTVQTPSTPNENGAGPTPVTAQTDDAKPTTPQFFRFETTATLVEDLRDVLTNPKLVHAEVWRVSRAIRSKARWSLAHLVPTEASPRVRALLVLASGCNVAESELVLGLLSDTAPEVRRAAALACGYSPQGTSFGELLGARVALGRVLSDRVGDALAKTWRQEKDPTVRDTIRDVLVAAGRTPPR